MEAGPLTHSQRIEAINALRTHRSPTFEDLAIGAITGAVVGVIVLGALLWGLGDVPEDRLGWLAVVGGAAGYWIRRFQLVQRAQDERLRLANASDEYLIAALRRDSSYRAERILKDAGLDGEGRPSK